MFNVWTQSKHSGISLAGVYDTIEQAIWRLDQITQAEEFHAPQEDITQITIENIEGQTMITANLTNGIVTDVVLKPDNIYGVEV